MIYKGNDLLFQTEDEGNHGNDDTRCFILSTLASQGRSKVHCVLCEEQLLVFDRYPLVDGTFFLSPRQHAKSCIEVRSLTLLPYNNSSIYINVNWNKKVANIECICWTSLQVKVEGRTQFLTVVCMGCLEGVNGRAIICRFCNQKWDGSSLVLGTMYSYDIFAAMPCCTERIKVSWKINLNFSTITFISSQLHAFRFFLIILFSFLIFVFPKYHIFLSVTVQCVL